jgi:hypothetical protein
MSCAAVLCRATVVAVVGRARLAAPPAQYVFCQRDSDDAVANDDPTSLRMGFGYRQARAAGLDGLRASRSPRQFNRCVEDSKATREALRYLRDVGTDPDWERLIKYRISEHCSAQDISEEIYWINRYAQTRKHFSIKWCLRHSWPF